MRATLLCTLAVVLAVVEVSSVAPAQDWPNWRGPDHAGAAAATDLPADFGPDKRVRWAAPMPGPGACTPIVVGDRVFLSSVDSGRQRLVALCLDRADGKVLWQRDAGSGFMPDGRGSRTARGRRTNYASPSPATDGERVVFFFGNGDLVGYDFAGEELWRRNVQQDYGNFAFQWTFSASPTIWEGRLFLPVLQRDQPVGGGRRRDRGRGRRGRGSQPVDAWATGAAGHPAASRKQSPQSAEPRKPIESFLLAIDPKTGETLYKHRRPSPARMESLEAYATAIPRVTGDGRKELLVVGGDVLTGHDPETGAELWRWGTWNDGHRQRAWRLVPTVTVGDGVAVVCAPKRAPVFAVRLGGEGDLGADALLWQSEGRPNPVSSDVPTPAYQDGAFYVLSDVQYALSKVVAKTGEVLWTTPLSRDHLWRASPTVADGKVWCINHAGQVVIVAAADGEVIHQVDMGREGDDHIRASIVVAHDSLFVRTNDKLYCIGK